MLLLLFFLYDNCRYLSSAGIYPTKFARGALKR